MSGELAHKIAMLPDSPGCYLMKNHGEILYIGKAKNLKNRVRQYFHSPGRPHAEGARDGRARGRFRYPFMPHRTSRR